MKSVLGGFGGAWVFVAPLAMACGLVACGSDVGGPQAATSGAAMEGPCEGDGCGDCRPVMIRTVTGKTIEVCGNDHAASEEDGHVGRSGHDDDGQPVATDHVDGDHAVDGGLGSEHAMGDAAVVLDHGETDASVSVDMADAGNAGDAGNAADAGNAGDANESHDGSTDAAADRDDTSVHESDAGPDCGAHS